MISLHTDITDSILRCAIAVHKELGPGLTEYAYEASLALEMDAQGIAYIRERTIQVRYRGVVVGSHRPDFIVENAVVVELKALSSMNPVFAKHVRHFTGPLSHGFSNA
jgi:GxxExxY protein